MKSQPEEIPEIKFYAINGYYPEQVQFNKEVGKAFPPVPSKKFFPDWFKKLPEKFTLGQLQGPHPEWEVKGLGDNDWDVQKPGRYEFNKVVKANTVRSCPGIYDYLSAGYIVPAWTDIIFEYHSDSPDLYGVKFPPIVQNIFSTGSSVISGHLEEQTKNCPINHSENQTVNRHFHKLITPWFVDLTPGYSLLITHPFYRTSPDYMITPGIMDPDADSISTNQINAFVKYLKPNTQIKIEAGDPLLQLIPFKRTNFKFSVNHDYEEKDVIKFQNGKIAEALTLKDWENSDSTLKNDRLKENKNYDYKEKNK